MLVSQWNRCCVVFVLVASLRTHQVSAARPKANSIKPGQLLETAAPATNHTASAHGGMPRKHSLLTHVSLDLVYVVKRH
uniref:Secreted protein n=1 Tax=Knipowitschia caucasica TaxID=637954 RepID=A0AAV2LKX0_KNICA